MSPFNRRWSSVVVAVTLAVRLLAPDFGHQCAMDLAESPAQVADTGAPAGIAQAGHDHGAAAAESHSDHSAHADHSAHTEAVAVTDASSVGSNSTDSPAHDCDCETTCCCVAAATAPIAAAPKLEAAFKRTPALTLGPSARWEPAWIDHVLPFNTPPPVATTLG